MKYCFNNKFILVVYDLSSVSFDLSLANNCFLDDGSLGFPFFFHKCPVFCKSLSFSLSCEKSCYKLQALMLPVTIMPCRFSCKKIWSGKVKNQPLKVCHITS